MRIIHGERITKQGKLSIGCSAVIFDESRQKILLTQRQDNGRWCLPGGHMEPGESVTEACAREVREETGLEVEVSRLVGIYSSPHRLHTYADGNKYHMVSLCFEAHPIGGALQLSDETTATGYFALSEISQMDVMEIHYQRIQDAFAEKSSPILE